MNSSDNYYPEILNNTIVYLYQYVVPVFYIIGNVGNLLCALVFSKKSWRKNVCVFYLKICLIFNTCYINSTMFGTIFILGFNIKIYNSNIILCKIFYYVSHLFSRILPTVLILASIDRLLISSQNIDTRLYSSKRLAYFSISICTFFWFIFYFNVLIKVNIQQIGPFYFVCYYDQSKSYLNFFIYSSLIFTILIFLFMFILSILTFKNVRHIKSIPRQQRKEIRSMTKKDFQLLRCLYAYDIVYIIFSIVVNVNEIYGAATRFKEQTQLKQIINNFILNFGTFLHHIPYCASFFIFIIILKAFRHEMKRMIYKILGKDITIIREEENIERDNIELNVVDRTIVLPA